MNVSEVSSSNKDKTWIEFKDVGDVLSGFTQYYYYNISAPGPAFCDVTAGDNMTDYTIPLNITGLTAGCEYTITYYAICEGTVGLGASYGTCTSKNI